MVEKYIRIYVYEYISICILKDYDWYMIRINIDVSYRGNFLPPVYCSAT